MAKENPDSISSKWRRVFESNPRLLRSSKNQEAIDQFKAANPGEDVDEKKLGVMANVKSQLRKKNKIAGRKAKVGRPPGSRNKATVAAEAATAVAAAPRAARASATLEGLEDIIDKSLSMAKHLGEDRLEDVVKLLRRARNKVIILAGE